MNVVPSTLADEVRALLVAAHRDARPSKEDARDVLLTRKRENLIKRYDDLKRVEGRVLSLIRRVDYSDINPTLVAVSPRDQDLWTYLRNILSSAPYDNQPGRSILMFVMDRRSGGVLGIVEVGSDLDALGPRDRYVGWTRVEKYRKRRMNAIANMTTCVVVQPFGALTGGKAAAAMVVSSDVSRLWVRKYGDPLVACSTTSLYGKSSQYNRLPMWKWLGMTPGLGVASISGRDYQLIRRFLREAGQGMGVSGYGGNYGGGKMPNIEMASKLLGVPRPSSAMPKGVYFAEFSERSRAYLRADTDHVSIDAPTIAERSKWWMGRWYAMRYPKVRADVESFDPMSLMLDNVLQSTGERSIDDAAGVQPDDVGANPAARSTIVG